jgi:hypothetical protein
MTDVSLHVQVMDQITGANGRLLPWEQETNMGFVREKLGIFVHPILQLLHRDPAQRADMSSFLYSCRHVLCASASIPSSVLQVRCMPTMHEHLKRKWEILAFFSKHLFS